MIPEIFTVLFLTVCMYIEISNTSNADPLTLAHLSRDFLSCASPGGAASRPLDRYLIPTRNLQPRDTILSRNSPGSGCLKYQVTYCATLMTERLFSLDTPEVSRSRI